MNPRHDQAIELWGLGLLGGALMACGLGRRRDLLAAALTFVGATALVRALTGHNDLATGRRWADWMFGRLTAPSEDPVESASEQSFPASDVPAWTPIEGATVGARD
jgi:hypothetical protein